MGLSIGTRSLRSIAENLISLDISYVKDLILGRESNSKKIYGGKVNLCVHDFEIFIELFQWEIFSFQLSLVIPIRLLGILTFAANWFQNCTSWKTHVFAYFSAFVSFYHRFKILVFISLWFILSKIFFHGLVQFLKSNPIPSG